MIAKILLLLGLVPVLVSFLARKALCEGVLKKEGKTEGTLTGQEIAERILKRGKADSVEIMVKKLSFVKLGPDQLILSPVQAHSKMAGDVAEAALLAGMVLMARQQEKVVGWRTWALKFSWAMPAFTTIVMTFAMVIGRMRPGLCLAVISGTLGLATLLLWFTLPVEKAAGKTVAEMLEETALIPRRSEAERLAGLVRALSWRRIIPGAIAWIGRK